MPLGSVLDYMQLFAFVPAKRFEWLYRLAVVALGCGPASLWASASYKVLSLAVSSALFSFSSLDTPARWFLGLWPPSLAIYSSLPLLFPAILPVLSLYL